MLHGITEDEEKEAKKYTVNNIMKFTIFLLYNVVWKLKTGFS